MPLKGALHALATLVLGVAVVLCGVTCSDSPTAPQSPDNHMGKRPVDEFATEPILEKVISVDYVQGTLPSGVLCEIGVPNVWNNDLVIYAHGYVRPQEPIALPDDSVDGVPVHEIITGMGYAWATTTYRRNGLVVPVAVEDLIELVDVFRAAYPVVNHVLLAGVSEGGAITTLAVEKHPDVFDGGLTACGPIGNFRRFKIFRHGCGLLHSNIPVVRYGHCNFTQGEVLAAFAVLVWKVTAADLLIAESVIPSPGDRATMLAIAGECGARPRLIPAGSPPVRAVPPVASCR